MADGGISLSDFVNPNSMITPGAAGAITMGVTNVLTSQFAFLPGNWTALLLSFLFGSLTFAYGARILAALAYFVINSLIIFVMAHGSNGIGLAATSSSAALEHVIAPVAALTDSARLTLAIDRLPDPRSLDRARPGNLILVQNTNTNTNTNNSNSSSTKDRGFFKSWSWSGR